MRGAFEMNLVNSFSSSFKGKVCLITGGSRGIGFETAKTLAQCGADVIICGREKQKLELACKKIKNKCSEYLVEYYLCDISNESEVKELFIRIFRRSSKRLDVLVCNAGILDDALIGMVNKEQIERVFSINTFGLIYCCQYGSRLIARSPEGGSIINISSIIGTNGNEGQVVYGASKAAVIGVTKSLAKELASKKIRVNAIAPGFIDTDMTSELPLEKYKERMESIKMGRIGSPKDIANTVLFLASDLSTYVTGQVIGVDGGMLI
tara:strand:+ start:4628 stop:5422 length:795 start_codon:yes stop_codon:yes gene_type:complete